MTTIFLDTVGLLAQWDQTDQWHEAAHEAFQKFVAGGDRTISTTFVFAECGNAAARRPYRQFVIQTREAIESAGQLIVPTPQDWQDAWAAYARGEAAGAGLVDQISFMVMRRLGVSDAFTNDRHFKAAGFSTLF